MQRRPPADPGCDDLSRGIRRNLRTVTIQGRFPTVSEQHAGCIHRCFPTFPPRGEPVPFQPLPPRAIPIDNATYFYTLPLQSGRYDWVVAVWQKKSAAALSQQNADTLLREVGFYRDHADTTSHGSGRVTVGGTGTDSIDFVIDFSHMHRICDYFPPCRSRSARSRPGSGAGMHDPFSQTGTLYGGAHSATPPRLSERKSGGARHLLTDASAAHLSAFPAAAVIISVRRWLRPAADTRPSRRTSSRLDLVRRPARCP